MTTPPLIDVPVRSAEELTARWADLLEPPVFGSRALWLTWLHDGRMLPIVVPAEDLPQFPDNAMLFGLLALHEAISEEHLDGGGHLALALCRPGHPEVTAEDDAWVGLLSEVLDDRIEGSWSLHLAAGGSVVPLVEAGFGLDADGTVALAD
jgi:hypothetical protein